MIRHPCELVYFANNNIELAEKVWLWINEQSPRPEVFSTLSHDQINIVFKYDIQARDFCALFLETMH